MNLDAWLGQHAERIQHCLDTTLPGVDVQPQELHKAMRHAALNGGKRYRAALCYAAAEALSIAPALVDPLAVAIELIHAYSLVHDDLPAMDDDALRRGQPTVHVLWDDAMGVLAGDALHALAFEHLLAAPALQAIDPQQRLDLNLAVAKAIGHLGMVGGQVLDLQAEGRNLPVEALENIHRRKTGALIGVCLEGVAIIAGASQDDRANLKRYALNLGLAYQVYDDVLDETADTQTLGKNAGADLARDKSTYPACLGVDASRALAVELAESAIQSLPQLPGNDRRLRELAQWAIGRSH
nr:polyprenyl synthetase family protein [Oceanococcus sp. HetDA_MAG_MS8]